MHFFSFIYKYSLKEEEEEELERIIKLNHIGQRLTLTQNWMTKFACMCLCLQNSVFALRRFKIFALHTRTYHSNGCCLHASVRNDPVQQERYNEFSIQSNFCQCGDLTNYVFVYLFLFLFRFLARTATFSAFFLHLM